MSPRDLGPLSCSSAAWPRRRGGRKPLGLLAVESGVLKPLARH